MKTAVEYFDEIKSAYNLSSDYALAPMLGLTRSAVSMGRKHNATLDDKTCHRIAELLKLDPALILAEMNYHRAKTDEARETWERIAATFRRDPNQTPLTHTAKTSIAPAAEDPVTSIMLSGYRKALQLPAIPERFKH
jgi:predicted transcriptional regulator